MQPETEKLVIAFLEGELDEEGAEALGEHLDSSPEDAGEFLALARQDRVLRMILGPASDRDISRAVVGEIENSKNGEQFVRKVLKHLPDRPGPRNGKLRARKEAEARQLYMERMAGQRRRTMIGVAAAAAVILVVTLIIVVFSGSGQGPAVEDRPGIAERPQQSPVPQPPEPAPEPPAPEPRPAIEPEPEPEPAPEPSPEPEPPAPEVMLAGELGWLKDVVVATAVEPGDGALCLAGTPDEGAPPGSSQGAPGGGPPKGTAKPGGVAPLGQPGETREEKEAKRFAGYFEFEFRAPLTVLESYKLLSGRAVSKKSLWLLYTKGEEKLTVFLSESGGEDTGFVKLELAGRALRAARKSGILIGFEGLPEETEAKTVTEQFLPEKKEKEDEQD